MKIVPCNVIPVLIPKRIVHHVVLENSEVYYSLNVFVKKVIMMIFIHYLIVYNVEMNVHLVQVSIYVLPA